MSFLGELRPYQEQAKGLITSRGKALLALDLGTGKTVVSIAAIEQLREEGKVKCALLIMSSSLMKQWEERINQFTDSTAVVIDGSISPKKRSKLLEELQSQPPDYLIFGIRQVISEFQFLQSIKPDLVLVDEVTCIKNFGTQQSKTIKKLNSTYRIGLTAEPIENGKLEELFSIMQWVDPTVFGSWQSFESNYIVRVTGTNIIDYYKNVNELHERLMNACIVKRRTDNDVSGFMPTVDQYNVYVKLDNRTNQLYQRTARDILQALYNAGPSAGSSLAAFYAGDKDPDSSSGLGELGSRLVGASLLLASPELLRDSAWRSELSNGEEGSKYARSLSSALRGLPEPFYGAKVEACTELAIDYLEEDPRHKVIVFSRFKGILPILEKELCNYNSVIFTGDMNGRQRGKAIAQFTNDPECRLFLSSDAGGYGVDLYAASHLINYDLPLSSGVFKQRNGRHVRASSIFRHVYIDNLIVENSIEEYFLSRLRHKDKVAKAALTGVSHSSGNVFDTTDSLTRFLKDHMEKI